MAFVPLLSGLALWATFLDGELTISCRMRKEVASGVFKESTRYASSIWEEVG